MQPLFGISPTYAVIIDYHLITFQWWGTLFRCRFISRWATIKHFWNMTAITPFHIADDMPCRQADGQSISTCKHLDIISRQGQIYRVVRVCKEGIDWWNEVLLQTRRHRLSISWGETSRLCISKHHVFRFQKWCTMQRWWEPMIIIISFLLDFTWKQNIEKCIDAFFDTNIERLMPLSFSTCRCIDADAIYRCISLMMRLRRCHFHYTFSPLRHFSFDYAFQDIFADISPSRRMSHWWLFSSRVFLWNISCEDYAIIFIFIISADISRL